MISAREMRSKLLAVVIAVILIVVGIWVQFFYSKGFVRTDATILSTQEEGYDSDNDEMLYSAVVQYTVGGVAYTAELGTHSSSYREGQSIEVLYDPENPSVIHAAGWMGIYFIVCGLVILVALVLSTIRRMIRL